MGDVLFRIVIYGQTEELNREGGMALLSIIQRAQRLRNERPKEVVGVGGDTFSTQTQKFDVSFKTLITNQGNEIALPLLIFINGMKDKDKPYTMQFNKVKYSINPVFTLLLDGACTCQFHFSNASDDFFLKLEKVFNFNEDSVFR